MGEDMAPYASMEHRRGFLGFGGHHEKGDAPVSEAEKSSKGPEDTEKEAVANGAAAAALVGEATTAGGDKVDTVAAAPDGSATIDIKDKPATPGEGAAAAMTDDEPIAPKVEIGQTVEPTVEPDKAEAPSGEEVQARLAELNATPADTQEADAAKPKAPATKDDQDPWVAGLQEEAGNEADEIDKNIAASTSIVTPVAERTDTESTEAASVKDTPEISTSTEIPVEQTEVEPEVKTPPSDNEEKEQSSAIVAETPSTDSSQSLDSTFPTMKVEDEDKAAEPATQPDVAVDRWSHMSGMNVDKLPPDTGAPAHEESISAEPKMPASPLDGMAESSVDMQDKPAEDVGTEASATTSMEMQRKLVSLKDTASELSASIAKLQADIADLDKAA